jgi:hypothetical protein
LTRPDTISAAQIDAAIIGAFRAYFARVNGGVK